MLTGDRIRATFNQTVAATGRLSSADPNLQNIPIRTPEGRRIREAFVADPGHLLLSADYSQIELRVLAHLSCDETLRAAFRDGKDIHTDTDSERKRAAHTTVLQAHHVEAQGRGLRREVERTGFSVLEWGVLREL